MSVLLRALWADVGASAPLKAAPLKAMWNKDCGLLGMLVKVCL